MEDHGVAISSPVFSADYEAYIATGSGDRIPSTSGHICQRFRMTSESHGCAAELRIRSPENKAGVGISTLNRDFTWIYDNLLRDMG